MFYFNYFFYQLILHCNIINFLSLQTNNQSYYLLHNKRICSFEYRMRLLLLFQNHRYSLPTGCTNGYKPFSTAFFMK